MKVRISDIPSEGLTIHTTMSLESLNKRMNQGRECDIEFTADPQLSLLITRNMDGAETEGMIRARFRQGCGRCLENVEREIEVPANFLLARRTEREEDAEGLEDQEGIVFFEGDSVDLEAHLQENIIVSLDLYWNAPLNDQGNCSICNRTPEKLDLEAPHAPTAEKKVTFGDLLAKAQKKKE